MAGIWSGFGISSWIRGLAELHGASPTAVTAVTAVLAATPAAQTAVAPLTAQPTTLPAATNFAAATSDLTALAAIVATL